MSNYINGKTLCDMYSISKKQLAYMCHYEYLDCFEGHSHSKVYSSRSKILKRAPKFIRSNFVSALRYNNVMYTHFVIDIKNSNYEKYLTLDVPEYILDNKNLNVTEHFNRIDTSCFLWTLRISDEKMEKIKSDLKNNKNKIKLSFFYSVYFKVFEGKLNFANPNELFLNIENMKKIKNMKIVVKDSYAIDDNQSNYCEVKFFEDTHDQGSCVSNCCTENFFNYKNDYDRDQFEFCQKVKISIIIYFDRNNQVVIKLLDPGIPTTLTNYSIHAHSVIDRNEIFKSMLANYNLYPPIIYNNDATLKFKYAEYLTLFNCLFSFAEQPSELLELKKDYFIFSRSRFIKLNYNFDEGELLKDFSNYIESLLFDEASVEISLLKLKFDEDCNNEKINKLITFWENFQKMHESILPEELANAINAYILKLSRKCANCIIYDEIFKVEKKIKNKNVAKSDESDSKNEYHNYKSKKIQRLFQYLDEYVKNKKLSEYYFSIKNLSKNKELIIKREKCTIKNSSRYREGSGDEGIS